MVNTPINDIRIGNIILYNSRYCAVIKMSHVKPGKGPAYQQTELKDIKNSSKLNIRFRSSDNVEKIDTEETTVQVSYVEREQFSVMNMETYEQDMVSLDLLDKDDAPFLREEMHITLLYHENDILLVRLPETVEVQISGTESVVKGQTATTSYKPANIEGHAKTRIMVPPFIKTGDRIVIKMSDKTYIKRV